MTTVEENYCWWSQYDSDDGNTDRLKLEQKQI